MKKSFLGCLATAALVLPLVASCGDNSKIEVHYWYRENNETRTVLEYFERGFEELHENVDVILEPQEGNYNEMAQLVVQGASARNYPNIIQAYPDNVATFLSTRNDLVVNLDEYINDPEIGLSAEDKEDLIGFDQGSNYAVEGTYSVPYYSSTEVMYYNRSALIGLTLPGVNNGHAIDDNYINHLTWEEMFEVLGPAIIAHDENLEESEKILKTNGQNSNGYYALLDYQSDDNMYITLSKQYDIPYSDIVDGVGTSLFNNDEAKALIKQYSEYAQDHLIISQGVTGDDFYGTTLLEDETALFIIDSTAGASWVTSNKNIQYDVAPIPTAEDGGKYVMSQGANLCLLNRDSESNRMAWEFYTYMANKENALYWALNTSYIPFRNSTYEEQAYIDATSFNGEMDPSSSAYVSSRVIDALEIYSSDYEYFIATPYDGSSNLREAVAGLMAEALNYSSGTPSDDVVNGWFTEAETAANN